MNEPAHNPAGAGLTLVLGGVRSGKSACAESLAAAEGGPALYLATGQAGDAEMAERIRRHRERRPAHWQTVEEPLQPASVLSRILSQPAYPKVLILDSLDVWVANLLLAHEAEEFSDVEALALTETQLLIARCQDSGVRSVLVSSEVGLSPVSPNRLGRRFQDLLGTVNQWTAAAADTVYLVVAGIPVRLKPA